MSVPLLRDTPIWKLQAALKCGSCKKGRYASLVHMIKLTQEREIAPSVWVHPTMRREGHEEMAPAPGTPYAVQDGKINATTYNAGCAIPAFCRIFHGTGGVGSAIAPDLTQVVKSLNRRQFKTIVSCVLKAIWEPASWRLGATIPTSARTSTASGPICAPTLMAPSAPAVHRKSARKMQTQQSQVALRSRLGKVRRPC